MKAVALAVLVKQPVVENTIATPVPSRIGVGENCTATVALAAMT
jgi:hypothetical protein